MPQLYPSWIEIPVTDVARALIFYCAVFQLGETPQYDEPGMQIAVLLPSDKTVRTPGVSLVASPHYQPGRQDVQVNLHVGDHAALDSAIAAALAHGGGIVQPLVAMDDGVRYLTLHDSEGNLIALSSYEEPIAP